MTLHVGLKSSWEGTALIAQPVALTASSDACLDCEWDDQTDVRFFLVVWRQARIAHEPFADVLRHRTRRSRATDAGVRGRGFDWDKARAIGWSLDQVYQTRGAAFMHPDNAVAVAGALCPRSAAR